MDPKDVYYPKEIEYLREHYDPENQRTWPFFVMEMPLTADGQGPATIGKDAVRMTYEIWDHLYCNTHGSFDNLSEAINHTIKLSNSVLELDDE